MATLRPERGWGDFGAPAPGETTAVDGVVELLCRGCGGAHERLGSPVVIELPLLRGRARRAYDRLREARLDDDRALETAWAELTSIEREVRQIGSMGG